MDCSSSPGYFDNSWSDLLAEISAELESGETFKNCEFTQQLFPEFVDRQFSEATCAYTYGLVAPSLGVTVCALSGRICCFLYGKIRERDGHEKRGYVYRLALGSGTSAT